MSKFSIEDLLLMRDFLTEAHKRLEGIRQEYFDRLVHNMLRESDPMTKECDPRSFYHGVRVGITWDQKVLEEIEFEIEAWKSRNEDEKDKE